MSREDHKNPQTLNIMSIWEWILSTHLQTVNIVAIWKWILLRITIYKILQEDYQKSTNFKYSANLRMNSLYSSTNFKYSANLEMNSSSKQHT